MTHQDAMRLGKCPDCKDGVLQHGPWTQEQMQAVANDIGMDCVDDFYDCCDDCFVRDVGRGDAEYAQSLVTDRKLVLAAD